MSNVALRPAARFEGLGLGTGTGTTVTAAGAANVKGSWASLGTTGFGYDGFIVNIKGMSAARRVYQIDIGIGATPDIIVTDLHLEFFSNQFPCVIDLPLKVPAGVALQMRCQSGNAGAAVEAVATGYAYDHRGLPGFSRAEQVAAMSASRPNNAVTETGTSWTAWTEIVASTSRRYQGLIALANANNDGTRTTAGVLMDLGKGAGGSEQLITTLQGANAALAMPVPPVFLPVDLPAASRLAYRVQCSDGAAADTISAAVMGIW